MFKVCILRLDHICFENFSSTFWQVRCCAHRTRRSCQKYDEVFFKFCGLLRKPKLYQLVFIVLGTYEFAPHMTNVNDDIENQFSLWAVRVWRPKKNQSNTENSTDHHRLFFSTEDKESFCWWFLARPRLLSKGRRNPLNQKPFDSPITTRSQL